MNSLLPRGLGLVMLAGLAMPAHANPVMECSTASASQIETGACLDGVQKSADAALDAIVGFAMNAASELDKATGRKSAVPALEAGQAAWADYRDKHCEYVGATFGGGSGTGSAILGCRIELARARSDELMEFTR